MSIFPPESNGQKRDGKRREKERKKKHVVVDHDDGDDRGRINLIFRIERFIHHRSDRPVLMYISTAFFGSSAAMK